jgi:PAS domain S-box-containing protein
MSLRSKTLIAVIIAAGLLVFCVFTTATMVDQKGVDRDEEVYFQSGARQVIKTYEAELASLNSRLADWATWDDNYDFVTNRNQAFITANINGLTLVNLNLMGMLFFDKNKTIVYATGLDSATGTLTVLPEAIRRLATTSSYFTTFSDPKEAKTGLFNLPQGEPVLFAARPIVHTDGTGPINGTLIFLRRFDDQITQHLIDFTGFSMTTRPTVGTLPTSTVIIRDSVDTHLTVSLQKKTKTDILGWLTVTDPFGKPAFNLEFNLPRSQYLASLNSQEIGRIVLTVSCLLFGLITIVILQYFVLSPLAKIRNGVIRIAADGQPHSRLPEPAQQDEIGDLTREINRMLVKIENSQKLLAVEKEKSKAYIDIVNVMIVVIAKDQTIQMLNKDACRILETTEENAVGKNWFETFIPVQERGVLSDMFMKMMAGNLGLSEHNENHVLTASGRERLFSWHNTLLKDEAGQVTAALSVAEDITEQSEAQKKLIEKAKLLTFTQQLALIGSWAFDLRTRKFTVMDDFVYRINGIDPAKTADTIEDLLHAVIPEDHQKIIGALASVIAKNASALDFFYRTTKARIVHVLAEVTESINGEPVRVLGAIQDVTDQKQVEEKLLARTKELETLNNLMIGREAKMVELKNELKELKKQADRH